jgi:hypothetical protein
MSFSQQQAPLACRPDKPLPLGCAWLSTKWAKAATSITASQRRGMEFRQRCRMPRLLCLAKDAALMVDVKYMGRRVAGAECPRKDYFFKALHIRGNFPPLWQSGFGAFSSCAPAMLGLPSSHDIAESRVLKSGSGGTNYRG